MNQENDILFTDKTAAAYVGGVKARAIREWQRTRGLPFIRITEKVCRIRKSELDAWVASYQLTKPVTTNQPA